MQAVVMTATAARRRAPSGLWTTTPTPPADTGTVVHVDGHHPLRPGDEVTIRGLGRARYLGHVNPDGSIDVHRRGCRSVMPDRVTTVHRKDKLR